MRVIYFLVKVLPFAIVAILLKPNVAQAQEYSPLIISEIGAFETADYEWIEIYNLSAEPIDLTDWKFYENSTNHGLKEFQAGLIIQPGAYAIIANKPDKFLEKYPGYSGVIADSAWSSLKETGEEVGLKNPAGDLLDNFTYLAAPDTALQKINLELADYSRNNWAVHPTSNSAGRANEFSANETASQPEGNNGTEPNPAEDKALNNDAAENEPAKTIDPKNVRAPEVKPVRPPIVLNELFPNPVGPDEAYEFIEIKNAGSEPYEIKGWSLQTSSFNYLIPTVTLGRGQILIYSRSQTNLALNNRKENLKLLDQNGAVIDQAGYTQEFEENISYQRFDAVWKQTARPSKGQENIYEMPNLAPVISLDCPPEIVLGKEFECAAGDSFDPNGQALTYRWILSDKNQKQSTNYYGSQPRFKITDPNLKYLKLEVSDGIKQNEKKITLKLVGIEDEEHNQSPQLIHDAMDSGAPMPATYLPSQPPTEQTPAVRAVSLDEIHTLPSGTPVIVQGMVSKKLRQNAKTLTLGEPETQILLGSDYWPSLAVGDIVAVSGKTGRQAGAAIVRVASLEGLLAIDELAPASNEPEEMSDALGVTAPAGALGGSSGLPQKWDSTNSSPPTTKPEGLSDPPVQKNRNIWYMLGMVIAAAGFLYFKIRQLSPSADCSDLKNGGRSPATLHVNGKAAVK